MAQKQTYSVFFCLLKLFFFSHVLLGNTFVQKCTFFYNVFYGTKQIFTEAKTKRKLNRCLTLFLFQLCQTRVCGKKVVFRRTLFSPKSLFWHFQAEVLQNTVSLFFKCYVLSLNVWLLFLFFCWSSKKSKLFFFSFKC